MTRLNNIFLILLLFLLKAVIGLSQTSVQFEHVSDDYAFSSNVMRKVMQDRDGFIWLCTEDGLNRFDGYDNVIFKHHPEDSTSISSGWTLHSYEDYEGRIWVGTKRGLNVLDKKIGHFQRFNEYLSGDTLVKLDDITAIYQNQKNTIWFGGKNIHRFDLKSGKFKLYSIFENIPYEDKEVKFIEADRQGKLIIGAKMGIIILDPETGAFSTLEIPLEGLIRGMHLDKKNNIWLVDKHDLLKINLESLHPETIAANIIPQKGYIHGREIVEDLHGNLWLGNTSLGLLSINPQTNEITSFQHDPINPNSLKEGIGEWLLTDVQGNLWIAGVSGLDRLSSKLVEQLDNPTGTGQFYHKQVASIENLSINQKMIRTFLIDKNKNLWVGTYEGLYKYRLEDGEMFLQHHFSHNSSNSTTISSNYIRDMIEDREGTIWVATRAGLNKINPDNLEIERVRFQHLTEDLSEEVFWSLCEDRKGNIWIGTQTNGLLKFTPKSGDVEKFTHDPRDESSIGQNEVLEIFEDHQGQIWAGTLGGGLNLLNDDESSFKRFLPDFQTKESISDDIVWAIHEDQQNRLWVGTQNGLNQLISEKEGTQIKYSFEKYLEEDGLINHTIHGIQEDKLGRLWISTIKGISCLNVEQKTFLNFEQKDGLNGLNFNPHAAYKHPETGELFFGGVNGFNHFQPDYFQADEFVPPVLVSSFSRFNKRENEGNPIVDYFFNHGESLIFSHLDDVIIFEMTLLNFHETPKNQYAYLLEEMGDTWVPLGKDRSITFTNLDIGDYTLKVRGANEDGIWSEEETVIYFSITPPWWWTNLAIITYMLLGIVSILWLYSYFLNKKLLEQEARQLKKMNDLKSHFFANISHEFRTPITLILGQISYALDKFDKHDAGLLMAQKSGKQLLSLINQLLDLTKIDADQMRLKTEEINIVPLLREQCKAFHSLAEQKEVSLVFHASKEKIPVFIEVDKLEKIMNNLLSNAIKFSNPKEKIQILVDASVSECKIQVRDRGVGIPQEKLSQIFNRFYQVDSTSTRKYTGTGIGLAFVKELVNLHGGEIVAESIEGEGTTFTVCFQLGNAHLSQDQMLVPKPQTVIIEEGENELCVANVSPLQEVLNSKNIVSVKAKPNSEQPLLLLVEDHPDMRAFIRQSLTGSYRILEAPNGKVGYELAIEEVPDLIISDVMMPEMDGIELTHKLRNDIKTNHIPIIILTAKATEEDKFEGLEAGGDIYLTKPFSREELLLRVKKMIENRRKVLEKVHQISLTSASQAMTASADQQFLERLQKIVEDRLSDEDFQVEELCLTIGMSSRQLLRKLKNVLGCTPSFYLRMARLEKGKKLLEAKAGNVNDVAMAVGYANYTSFTRAFTDAYGIAPSKLLKKPSKVN